MRAIPLLCLGLICFDHLCLKSLPSARFRPSTRNYINATSCYLAAPSTRSPGRQGTAEVAQVEICKCSDTGETRHCDCLRVSFQALVRGKQTQLIRQEITGSTQGRGMGWVEGRREGGREIDSETGPSDHLVLFVRSGGKRCRAGNMRMCGRRAQPRL